MGNGIPSKFILVQNSFEIYEHEGSSQSPQKMGIIGKKKKRRGSQAAKMNFLIPGVFLSSIVPVQQLD